MEGICPPTALLTASRCDHHTPHFLMTVSGQPLGMLYTLKYTFAEWADNSLQLH